VDRRSWALVASVLLGAVWCCGSAVAEPSPRDELARLFQDEVSAALCGFELSEAEETRLDEAQTEARLTATLSFEEASQIYRQVRDGVRAAAERVCKAEP
jgi:hypothetical protein